MDVATGIAMSGSAKDTASRVAIIRHLNDQLRTTFTGGQITITAGVGAMPAMERRALLKAVRAFAAFDSENDPRGEHDFGAIDQEGTRYFWKIDYYDVELTAGSPDPADPEITRRVLTVMRADEY